MKENTDLSGKEAEWMEITFAGIHFRLRKPFMHHIFSFS